MFKLFKNLTQDLGVVRGTFGFIGIKRDLWVKQGRKFKVIPKALPGLPINPSINPFLPIPPQHQIVRVGGKKQWVLLEHDGILDVAVRFNISDRKKLGINNKVRKFSSSYKVVCNNFKQVVNDYINNGFQTPVGPPNLASVKGIVQTFTGVYNGVKLTVSINSTEFGPNLARQLNGVDQTDRYLKVITYKFHQAWLATINQPGFVLPVPRQNVGTAPVTDNAVTFNPESPVDSGGLFLFKTNANIFDDTPGQAGVSLTREIRPETDIEGRDEPVAPQATTDTQENLTDGASNGFTYFSLLPLSFTILERQNFVIPVLQQAAQVNQIQSDPIRNAVLQLSSFLQSIDVSINNVNSLNVFTLDPNIFNLSLQNINGNEKIELHQLIIMDRKTEFFMDQFNSVNSIMDSPFVYTFYENVARYERCYVDASYLAACMDVVLLQHIRKTHSMRIIYNSIEFVSYQKKVWYNTEESFCKKIPLKNIDKKSIPFNALVSGEFPGENVNTNANLMFTAIFTNTQGVFFRTNRFITSSAFSNQAEIQDLGVRSLWESLERALSSSILISAYPLVGLVPCFSRGEIIQVSQSVLFKGLVSNSGSTDGFQ